MRRFKPLAIALILLMGLAVPGHGPAQIKPPTPLGAHLKKRYTDDLPGLLKRRYIRVLTTFNKTNFYIAGTKIYGFEYSLMKEFEKYLNRKIKRRQLKVVIEFIPVRRDQLLPYLVKGYGDIAAAGLTITPERLKQVDFTEPYLYGINEIVVVHRSVRTLKSLEDLAGRKVYVRKSSSYYESLRALNRRLKTKGLRPVKIVPVDESLETEDILELVNSGAIKITISDSHIAEVWSKVLKNIRLLKDLKVRQGSKIAWAVRKNNPQLKRSLNRFIKKVRKGTLLGNIYFKRYFKNTKWIKNPLSSSEKRKIKRYQRLFKKYARKYRFDWPLIMAMAYQESGLNHKRRSHRGAVGIMQIKPATARQMGFNSVRSAEDNIHAAVKYLAYLRDRYFNDKSIRPRDRVRFSLAAYNAGPARVKKARALARKMGLNPDRWFRNVEIAMLRLVGQETVRYVSNINKYYILYKLALQSGELRF